MKKGHWIVIWIFCIAFWSEGFGVHVIHEIPPSGIVISEPGTYVFKRNLTWHPSSNAVAITIQANDVTLDMRGFTLKSMPTAFQTIGISALLSENVQIRNGKVQNMGLSGVQCTLCLNVSIRNMVVDGLNLSDTTTSIVPTGILTSECINVAIDRCTVKNIHVRTASAAGIQLTATLASKVTNCKMKNLLNKDGACSGIGHLLCVMRLCSHAS